MWQRCKWRSMASDGIRFGQNRHFTIGPLPESPFNTSSGIFTYGTRCNIECLRSRWLRKLDDGIIFLQTPHWIAIALRWCCTSKTTKFVTQFFGCKIKIWNQFRSYRSLSPRYFTRFQYLSRLISFIVPNIYRLVVEILNNDMFVCLLMLSKWREHSVLTTCWTSASVVAHKYTLARHTHLSAGDLDKYICIDVWHQHTHTQVTQSRREQWNSNDAVYCVWGWRFQCSVNTCKCTIQRFLHFSHFSHSLIVLRRRCSKATRTLAHT